MSFTRRRTLAVTKRKVKEIKYDKGKLSFFLVVVFLVVFGVIVLTEIFFVDITKSDSYVGEGGRNYEYDSSWETPRPLPQLSRNIKMENAVLVDGSQFRKKILSKQVEMQQLIRDISASMSKNPMIQKIRASREQFKYEDNLSVKIDPNLENYLGLDATWQAVNGTTHKFYVYSAFYDNRSKPLIRVIAATKTKKSDKVWCKLYYKHKQPILVTAGINAIRENWNLKYSAAFVTCELFNKSSDDQLEPPLSVSIVAKLNLPASNQLMVHYAETGIVPTNATGIGVCVKPLHYNYNKTYQLIQFIELNKLLGVTRFTLYNDTITDEVNCVLNKYIEEGVVNLLPWKLNMESQKEIRTEGLFAALNDCLYRNMNRFKYLMLIDLDEFIIPHQDFSLVELLKRLGRKTMMQSGKPLPPDQVSSYSFQNAFFYLQWPDDDAFSVHPEVTTLLKTKRKLKFHPPKQRSKYICIPAAVKEAGNHFVWEFQHGKTLNVQTRIGFLHHYRICEFGGNDCINNGYVEDTRIPSTWGPALMENIRRVSQNSNCDL